MAAVMIGTHESTDALAEVLGAVFDIVEEFSEVYRIPVTQVREVQGLPGAPGLSEEIVYFKCANGTNLCFAP